MPLNEYDRAASASVDETEVVAHLLKHRTGRANLMLDVGAHVGTSAAYFDKLDWRIICFEPDPENRFFLVKRFGGKPNVLIDMRAVSDKSDKAAKFFKSPQSTGISGLHAFTSTHGEAGTVEVTTVGEILDRYKVSKVAFLKIDVEGFDFSVLRGVPWDRVQPDVIEAEFEDTKTRSMGHTWRDLCAYLSQRGYAVYISEWHSIVRYGIRHDWRRVFRFGESEPNGNGWGNLLAFKEDPGLVAVQEAFKACIRTMDTKTAEIVGARKTAALVDAGGHSPAHSDVRQASHGNTAERLRLVDRLYRATENQPSLRFAGGFVRWVFRTARRYALPLGLLLLIAASALAGAFVAPEPWLRLASGGAAGVLFLLMVQAAGFGYALHRIKRDQLNLAARQDVTAGLSDGVSHALQTVESLKKKLAERALEPSGQTKSDESQVQIAALEARVAMLGASLEDVEVTVSKKLKRVGDEIAEKEARINIFDYERQTMGDRLEALREEARELEEKLTGASQHRAQALREEIKEESRKNAEALKTAVKAISDELASKLEALQNETRELEGALTKASQHRTKALREEIKEDLSGRDSALDSRLSSLDGRLTDCRAEVSRINQAIGSLDDLQDKADDTAQRLNRLWSIMPPTNAAVFQYFNRTLTEKDARELSGKWSRELSVSASPKALSYAADRACEIETRLHGRFATSVETLLLRTMLAQSIKRKSIRILEIGCLFGIAAAFMYDQLKRRFEEVHITVLDPLDGYYSSASLDVLTGEPVNRAALEENFESVGLKPENYTIIQKISTEDDALEEARRLAPFDVIILDGDHSYSGVKADYDNYKTFLRRGGLMVFDDYGTEEWPDIAKFVDEKVASDDSFALVGAGFRTAAYRMVKTANPAQSRRSTARSGASRAKTGVRKSSAASKSSKPKADPA